MSGGAAFLPSVKKRPPHDSWLADHHPPLDFNSSGAPSYHHVGLQSVFVSPKKPIKEEPAQTHLDVIDTFVSDTNYQPTYQWQPPQMYTAPYIAQPPVYQDYQYYSATEDKFVLKQILRSLDKAFHFLKNNQEKSSWNVVIDALNANSKDKKYENYVFLYGVLCFHCDDSKTIRAIVPTNCAFKFLVALHDDKHDLNKEQLVSFAQCYFSGVSSVCKKQSLLDIIYDDCLKCKAIKSGNYEEFMLEVKAKEFIEKCQEKEKARDVELLKLKRLRSPERRRVSPMRTSRDKSTEKRPKKSRSQHRHKSPSNHSRYSRKRSRSSNRSRSKKRSRSKSSRSRSSKHSPKHIKVNEDDMEGFIVLDECNDKMNISSEEIKEDNSPKDSDNLQKPTERTEIEGDKTKATAQIPGTLETKIEQVTALSAQNSIEDNMGKEEIVDMEGFIILDECDEKVNTKPKDAAEIEIITLDSGEEELKGVEEVPVTNDVEIQNLEPAISLDSKSNNIPAEIPFRVLESDNIDQVLDSSQFSDVPRLEPVDSTDADVLDMEVADELPSNVEGIVDKLPVSDDQKENVESTKNPNSDITQDETCDSVLNDQIEKVESTENQNSDITQDETCDSSSKDDAGEPDTSQSHTALPYQDVESSVDNNEISLSIMKAYEFQNQEDMNREESFFDEIDRILVDFEKQNALDQNKAEETCEVQKPPLENVLVQQSVEDTPRESDEHDVGQASVEDTPRESDDPFGEGENSNSSHSNEESEKPEKSVDFKARIKNEQISNSDLKAIVDRIKANDKTTKEKYVLKKGMLCEKTSAGEVRIVTHPEGIRSFCFIVHTMAGTHAPYNNALDIFHKHFMPYDGIEAVMEEVIATCEKCFKTV